MGLVHGEVGAGQVQPRQHLAHLFDVLQVRRIDMPALQPVQQRRRPALQPVQDLTLRVGLRLGHGQAVPCQVLHVVQVEGQFLEGQPLEQRQHPFALRGAGEVVGVLDALGDAVQRRQSAAAEGLHETVGLLEAHLGVDRHAKR